MPLYDDRFYFRPLIPLLFVLMAGIAAARTLPGLPWLALAVAIPSGSIILALLLSNRSARVLPLIFFFALGYLCLTPWQLVPNKPDHVSRYTVDKENSWQISGRIATAPIREGYRLKFELSDLQIADLNNADAAKKVQGRLRMTVYGSTQPLHRHDRIRFESAIRPFHNFNNPGGFNYKTFMAYQNIWASAYASGERLGVKKATDVNPAVAALGRMRQAVSRLIEDAVDGDRRAILTALVLGSRDEIAPALKNAFDRAGVSHVLAISGLHIGIVAAFAFFCFKRLLMLWPAVLHRGWSRKIAALLAVLPVLIYGLLAGLSPSTQRATIMVSVFLLSFLIERDHDLPNTLAAAALIILIIYPPALFAISFQLSFMAVLSIIIGLSSTWHWQAGFQHNRLMAPVLSFMMVSLFAILGTTPLIMHYFNQAAFLGLFTNLFVIPIVGFFAVPLTLFSVLVVFPLYPPLAALGLKAAGLGIELALAVIYPVGQWPYSAVKTITPSVVELICIYILLFGLLCLLGRAKGIKFSWPALKQPISLIVIAAFIGLSADIVFWWHDRFWKNDFSATIVDVGQGSAALLELPGGHRMLVDGGGFTTNAVFDVGKNVVAPLLWDRKIGTIDTVVLSHPDADHLNGLIYILNHFHVDQVISTHQTADSSGYAAFEQAIRKNHIKHLPFDQIPRRFQINGVTFDILHPLPAAHSGRRHLSNTNNDHSIVLKASYNGRALLLPGDIMKAAEKALISETENNLQADVLIAPHHGSKTSSTKSFLDAVDPIAVIVSAGIQNRFDLPAPSVIRRYRNKGCRILRTSQNGAVEITMDGRRVTLQPFLGEPVVLGVGY